MISQPEAKAAVSLDLDDKWTYMKTRGLAGWQDFPSYLPIVVPRVLRLLQQHSLHITFFIVGQDAALPRNAALLRSIAESGHEIGNHSFHHEPWLHLYSDAEIKQEIGLADDHIRQATGQPVRGFRGPGFSFSNAVAQALVERGYLYDASTLPTFLGPLARAYYLLQSGMDPGERRRRAQLFGRWRDGFRPLKPHMWPSTSLSLVEIPVSTMPVLRIPFHLSYLIWLSGYSELLARAYLRSALALCRIFGLAPSFLLHPLDFIGSSEAPELAFFPGMHLTLEHKMKFAEFALNSIARSFQTTTLKELASATQETCSRPRSAGPEITLASDAPVKKGQCAYVMPVFQAQPEFDETMRSLALSSVPCTVYVVDDGSDPPVQIAHYGPSLCVHLLRLPRNRGIVAALNAGLKAVLAEGYEYIARIDAGDYSSPDRLARQIGYLEDHPDCKLVGSDATVRAEDGSYCFTIQPPRNPRVLSRALHERAWLLHPGVMYRASVFWEVGLYTDTYRAAEDYEMFLRIAARHEVGVVPEPLLTYILRRGSISGRNARVQAISRLRVQFRYFRWSCWVSYYGVLCTIGTLLMPRWAKNRVKTRFLYSQAPPRPVKPPQSVSVHEGGS